MAWELKATGWHTCLRSSINCIDSSVAAAQPSECTRGKPNPLSSTSLLLLSEVGGWRMEHGRPPLSTATMALTVTPKRAFQWFELSEYATSQIKKKSHYCHLHWRKTGKHHMGPCICPLHLWRHLHQCLFNKIWLGLHRILKKRDFPPFELHEKSIFYLTDACLLGFIQRIEW